MTTTGTHPDELKRRRREREQAERAKRQQPPLANGHDKHAPAGREIAVADWNSLGPPTAQDNLVAGLIGEQQFGMVYGESGSGKSFATFDMMAHYALGREWMGHKVKGGGVLYIAAEGRGGWANRVEAFCIHHGLDEEQRTMIPFGFVLESVNLGRTGNGDAGAVVRAAEKYAKKVDRSLDMIVVDTMARATPGANENDAGDMGAFVANMDLIRRSTGASPVIVHHSGKNAQLGARGHSSLRGAVDTEIEVERLEDGSRVMRLRKSRDGSDTADIAFTLKVIEIGRDVEGQPITSCVIIAGDGVIEPRRKARDKSQWQQAIDYLGNALVDFPAEVPHNGKFPTNVGITTTNRFREALERASIIDGETAGTRRVQWKRIKDKMLAKGLLVIEGEYCWRPDSVTANGSSLHS
jgi:RecA/RadA recombinase